MADVKLALTATAGLLAVGAFALAARTIGRRTYSPENQAGAAAFVAWWGLLALQGLADVVRVLQGIGGAPDDALFLALIRLKIVAAALAVAAMTYYLAHLWGAPRVVRALSLPAGILHGVVFLYLLERRLPGRAAAGEWSTTLVLTQPPLLNAQAQMLGTTLFFLPPILFALAYLLLWPRASDRSGRARILGVSIALLVFHVAAILRFDPDRGDSALLPLLALLDALAAAVVTLVYAPPRWLRRRWRIEPASPAPGRA